MAHSGNGTPSESFFACSCALFRALRCDSVHRHLTWSLCCVSTACSNCLVALISVPFTLPTYLLPRCHTGWSASSGPLGRLQNSEWAPLGRTFWRCGPLGNFWSPIRRMGTPSGPFFFMVWASFLGPKEHESLKHDKIPNGSTKNFTLFEACVFTNLRLASGKKHIAKMQFVFQNGLSSFLHNAENKENGPRGPSFDFGVCCCLWIVPWSVRRRVT